MTLSRKQRNARSADRSGDQALAEELARQNAEALQRLRHHARLELRLELTVRPGNMSAGNEPIAVGQTLDVSPGGCRARLSAALLPGDIFTAELTSDQANLPRVHCQCMRCALVGDSEFEVGLRFLSTLTSEILGSSGRDDLLD